MNDIPSNLAAALEGRYTIERELGQGGMATVYLAEDLKHKRQVAVKVLRPELAAVLGAERFVQEITTTASLQHPHILPLFDSGKAGGREGGTEFLYYVMPYIEGETLRQKLDRETQLGIEEAVGVATAVADALDYAHRQGVIHRDIKPENILLHDGRPMVADFGIALAVSAAAGGRMTETGLSLGTPHYMSPEQATAEKDLTARSDVYSLGSVLYEMLTGEPPHMGNSAQQIIMKIVTDEARPVTDLRKSVPPNVAAAVATSLEKLPADRFASAAEFAEALTNLQFATLASTVGVEPVSAGKGVSRSLFLAVAGLAIVFATGAIWGWVRPRPLEAPIRYRIALSDQPIPPGLVGRNLALSPDGRTIVFSQVTDGERQLWLKTPDRADAEPLSGTAEGRSPTFSPDGEWIAFWAAGTIRKIPRLGGAAVTIADSAGPFFVAAVAWLQSDTVLFNDDRLGLRAVHKDGGPVRVVLPRDSLPLSVMSIAGTPDSKGALLGFCNFSCDRAELAVVDLESGAVRRLGGDDIMRAWSVADGRVVFVRGDGGVFAAPFDLGSLDFQSAPIPVLQGVRRQGADVDIALSTSGTLLYVPGVATGGTGALTEAVWVERDGRVTPIDSGWSFDLGRNGGVALSPDGRRLALGVSGSGISDIWVKELDRGPFTRLTFDGDNIRPVWTDDARSILFVSQPDSGSRSLRRRRADGTGSAETLLEGARDVWEVRPLRDTTRLLVRFGIPPTRDVFLATRDAGAGDSGLVPLLANDGYEEVSIALSPDERWLAYASNESGRYEVYVRPFPDVDAGRWQISRDGGNEPLWARSGRELFFRSADGDLIAVPIGDGPGFTMGDQQVLFREDGFVDSSTHPEYDVSPDDQRFVFLRVVSTAEDAATATTAIVVSNWLEEIGAR